MQIEKNQEEINFHIVGTNFRKNLHLEIALRVIQFHTLHENFIFADAALFSFIFLCC